jgi:hypothetical protein
LGSNERKGKLKLSTRYRVLMFAFFVVLAAFATFYTLAAYRVAGMWACGGSAACWCCMGTIGNATFFPWPRGPLGVCAEVITKMDPVDQFIYLYLIRNGILIAVCVSLWILAFVYFFKATLPLFRKEPKRDF